MVSVPFIGCKSDGQVGPQEAPKGTSRFVPINRAEADNLAYYKSAQGLGVLAPSGWHCFGLYGSGGDALFVSPEEIDRADKFPRPESGFPGPAIEVSRRFGETIGRFDVADVIARVFPEHNAFVTGIMKSFDQPASEYTFGPYPSDTLKYKSSTVVEYTTPAQSEELGTRSWLKRNSSPIEGVAMLVGHTPDLLLLSVRLPDDLASLTPSVVSQIELDAARLSIN
jgi:hypothetical protein